MVIRRLVFGVLAASLLASVAHVGFSPANAADVNKAELPIIANELDCGRAQLALAAQEAVLDFGSPEKLMEALNSAPAVAGIHRALDKRGSFLNYLKKGIEGDVLKLAYLLTTRDMAVMNPQSISEESIAKLSEQILELQKTMLPASREATSNQLDVLCHLFAKNAVEFEKELGAGFSFADILVGVQGEVQDAAENANYKDHLLLAGLYGSMLIHRLKNLETNKGALLDFAKASGHDVSKITDKVYEVLEEKSDYYFGYYAYVQECHTIGLNLKVENEQRKLKANEPEGVVKLQDIKVPSADSLQSLQDAITQIKALFDGGKSADVADTAKKLFDILDALVKAGKVKISDITEVLTGFYPTINAAKTEGADLKKQIEAWIKANPVAPVPLKDAGPLEDALGNLAEQHKKYKLMIAQIEEQAAELDDLKKPLKAEGPAPALKEKKKLAAKNAQESSKGLDGDAILALLNKALEEK